MRASINSTRVERGTRAARSSHPSTSMERSHSICFRLVETFSLLRLLFTNYAEVNDGFEKKKMCWCQVFGLSELEWRAGERSSDNNLAVGRCSRYRLSLRRTGEEREPSTDRRAVQLFTITNLSRMTCNEDHIFRILEESNKIFPSSFPVELFLESSEYSRKSL